ncbi:zinc finger protein 629-like isoform X1 [Danaus plexippus]|uniref:zinc finger protein 629-like isoform X1 n=1 Tax=Danaus plexippus TaxID=13037 RepID=UPI002AB09C01|nr:zinc finger protein 629-like isoform X1 [Danaus plexippus]
MEKRKESLRAAKVCRFCLSQDQSLDNLYDRNRAPKNAINLHLKILSCVAIEVFPSDKMPAYICHRCKTFMTLFYDFKQIVRRADESILQFLQNGTPMETILWPSSLAKIIPSPNEINVKTIVEDGTTIQVSSQDISDSDEEDGNVYNVKIGDGPDDSNTTCIKVVTSKEEVKEDSVQSDREVCWPCDECDCTYPLQQLLALHKRQKHRPRTVVCDKCDAKFFSKYDLSTHLLRHTDETPFQCVACDKKFKRLILLKRHEKIIHADLPQQVCPNCPATFLSIEELEAHKKRHIHIERPYSCNECDKKFHEKATLQRHIQVVHNREPTYCCGYCPERFVSLSKLTKHVRSHAGDRPYPCKFCDKSFTKSHHYTRHLRVKHRSRHTEQYRCEQCDDTFTSQDDLIYHSAIHATQNLICPLCQEKFDNVDDVTTHIKSHVSGVEFECDFCELVFTSKEKLDNHLITAHEDELQHVELDEMEELEESSIEEIEEDNGMNLKDEGDHMVIEINKEDYMINKTSESDVKVVNAQSEDSESENTYTELATVDTLAVLKKNDAAKTVAEKSEPKAGEQKPVVKKFDKPEQTPSVILQKSDEIKRKAEKPPQEAVPEKKDKKTEINSGGASDKSLRLLEKELQDLKRTNTKSEVQKASPKNVEMLRTKRPQLQTSTPKSYGSRSAEEKKFTLVNKTPNVDKKPERRITKENKEPKDVKETKNNNGNKDDKESPKSVIKNGSNNDKNASDDGIRRSTRPSKIKDYAKMVRDKSQTSSDLDESSDEDEEYRESDRSIESRTKIRRINPVKTKPADVSPIPATAPRKRGRPRKESKTTKDVPTKVRKDDGEAADTEKVEEPSAKIKSAVKDEKKVVDTEPNETTQNTPKTPPEQKPAAGDLLVSPSGQTLKKVPIKALPPGIKPLPLPVNARPVASGELCEMQIGKKVVKVQKIVMTKAEVEAMAKKGLVEMKDGTMVLKQGIKLPSMENSSAKTSIADSDAAKESLVKKEKAVPTRCDLGDDS